MEERHFEKERRQYEIEMYLRNRKYTLYGVLLSVLGLATILTKELILNFADTSFSIAFLTFGALSLAMGVGLLLYRYLQTGTFGRPTSFTSSDNELRIEIENLRIELLKLRRKSGQSLDSEYLSETINKVIENTLTEEYILSKVDEAYDEKAIEQAKTRKIYEDFENLSYRIEGELSRLRRSANLNLVIGTLTTSLAIIALGYEVFKGTIDFSDTVKLLSHYLPRLSLVVFIEIFAFFFLKLYKASLEDIKYFSNEKTNIDFKLISLKTAIHSENQELIKSTVEELVKTERNFKLRKDESTVELEKLKSNNENNKLLTQIIGKLTDKV